MVHTGDYLVAAYNENGRRVGQSHPKAKLSDEQIDKIREDHEERGMTAGQLAIKYGSTKKTIEPILSYKVRCQTPANYRRIKVK